MQRNEEFFRLLIETTTDLILIVNSDNEIVYQSPSVSSVLGYDAVKVAGNIDM